MVSSSGSTAHKKVGCHQLYIVVHEIRAVTHFNSVFEGKTWLEATAKLHLWAENIKVSKASQREALLRMARKHHYHTVSYYIATVAPLRIDEFTYESIADDDHVSLGAISHARNTLAAIREFFSPAPVPSPDDFKSSLLVAFDINNNTNTCKNRNFELPPSFRDSSTYNLSSPKVMLEKLDFSGVKLHDIESCTLEDSGKISVHRKSTTEILQPYPENNSEEKTMPCKQTQLSKTTAKNSTRSSLDSKQSPCKSTKKGKQRDVLSDGDVAVKIQKKLADSEHGQPSLKSSKKGNVRKSTDKKRASTQSLDQLFLNSCDVNEKIDKNKSKELFNTPLSRSSSFDHNMANGGKDSAKIETALKSLKLSSGNKNFDKPTTTKQSSSHNVSNASSIGEIDSAAEKLYSLSIKKNGNKDSSSNIAGNKLKDGNASTDKSELSGANKECKKVNPTLNVNSGERGIASNSNKSAEASLLTCSCTLANWVQCCLTFCSSICRIDVFHESQYFLTVRFVIILTKICLFCFRQFS